MNKFEDTIKKLKKSPIFALTLGAKELCHSNYWAWLIDANNEFAKVFFPNIKGGIKKVYREKEHMDLVLETSSGDYIIENKLKSLPNKEQLEKYHDKEKNFVQGVICGIVEPSFDIPNGWKFLSYKKIAEGIDKIKASTSLENDQILSEYIRVIQNIYSVLNDCNNNIGQKLAYKDFESLSEIKLDDIAKKLNADKFVKHLNDIIRTQIENRIKNKLWKLEISSNFSNKYSLVDIRFIRSKNTSKEMAIGIQIQAGKFERAILTKERKDEDKLFQQFKALNWFSDYNNEKMFLGKQTSQKKKYCSYKNSTYLYLYQYFNIQDYSFENLDKEINRHLEIALEIINQENL